MLAKVVHIIDVLEKFPAVGRIRNLVVETIEEAFPAETIFLIILIIAACGVKTSLCSPARIVNLLPLGRLGAAQPQNLNRMNGNMANWTQKKRGPHQKKSPPKLRKWRKEASSKR